MASSWFGAAYGNYGTDFRITPSGRPTTVFSFNLTDGAYPSPGLVQAADGDSYGTAKYGGSLGRRSGLSHRESPLVAWTRLPKGELPCTQSLCEQVV